MFNRWKQRIEKAVNDEIERRFGPDEKPGPPSGYNPLDRIRGAMYHWMPVPFAGDIVWCKLRTLNATQIESCGDIGLIRSGGDDAAPPDKEVIIELRNTQEALIKAALMSPTYEDIERMIYDEDHVIDEYRKELAELEAMVESANDMTPEQRDELNAEMYRLKLYTGFVLPEDTFAYLTSWILGIDVSDIKKITREQLYRAAIMAKNGSDNPSDHISGIFTDRDRGEIDRAAWSVFNEHKELESIGKGNLRWIGGPAQ